MKKCIIILFIFLSARAGAQFQITGTVTDTLGTPVSLVTVSLLSIPDSNIVKGTLSDQTGRYLIGQLKSGKYFLKFSATGYHETNSYVFEVDSVAVRDIVFDIRLPIQPTVLNDVSVTAKRRLVEFKNGNTIVNVENSPLAKGNSVYDLLMRLPSVSVYENSIMIQGKTGVVVLIDDRPQRLSGSALIDLLKSMNADLLKSIEVLKNPPVKFDASGTSGMINIKTKKVTLTGLTGSLFSSYSQGYNARFMPGGSLNYKSKKFILYSNISGETGIYRESQTFISRFFSNSSDLVLRNENIAHTATRNLSYKAGMDWMPTISDVLGFKIEGTSGNNTTKTIGRTSASNHSLGFDYLNADIFHGDKWQSNNYNINYEHKVDTAGSALVFVADFTDLPERLNNKNINLFYDKNGNQATPPNNYRSSNVSNSHVLSARVDFVKVLNSNTSYETGLKASHVKTSNTYLFERDVNGDGLYLNDKNISNNFTYSERTYAAYFDFNKSIKNLSFKLGTRLEHTSLTGESAAEQFGVSKRYLQLFPNLSFSYKKNSDHVFQLNLSRRTDRPNFSDLNPFMLFLDQYSFQQGNPFLYPSFTSRADFSYNYRNMLSNSVGYSYTPNIIMQYVVQNDTAKTTIQSIKNMRSGKSLEYSIFYQKAIMKNWNATISGSFSYLDYKGEMNGTEFHRTGINYFGNISNIISIGKTANMEVNGVYSGPNIYGIVRLKPKWMISLAFKKTLIKNNLDFTVGVDDVFNTFISKLESIDLNQNWTSEKGYDTRRFKLSLNYKFGNTRIKERNVRNSNEQEKGRLNH